MSYILDALRRSQAERERGHVPGLDAQPAAVAAASSGAPRAVPLAWLAAAATAAVLIVVGVAAWLRPGPSAQVADAASTAQRPVPAPAPAAPQPGLAPTVATAPPPPAAMAPPLPPSASAPPLPIVVSAPPAPPAAAVTPVPSAAPAPAAAPTAPPAPPATRTPPARIPSLAELGADQRRDLPALAVGGSVWSDSAANRFVIINGQVVREGEAAAPGVILERIGPKAAVLRWRELRFELAY